MSSFDIPSGYVMNASGDLIKESNLSARQVEEDKLCKTLFPMATALNQQIAKFKHAAMHEAEECIRRMLEDHGIKQFAKTKGNVQFTSVNGLMKIQRAVDERIDVDSSIEAVRKKLDHYHEALKADAGDDAQEWIDTSFETKRGKISTSKLIDLLNRDIDHPLYLEAMEVLRKALFVSGSKAYLRFYFKEKADGEWLPLPLQFSSIEGKAPEAKSEPSQETENAA